MGHEVDEHVPEDQESEEWASRSAEDEFQKLLARLKKERDKDLEDALNKEPSV